MQSFQQARQAQHETQSGLASTVKAQSQAPAKNRGRIDVLADILNCCRSPANKSHVMLHANVNSIVATRMIEKLTETGLLDSVHDDGNVVYLATSKGAGFISKYIELQRLISPDLVPVEAKTHNPNRINVPDF